MMMVRNFLLAIGAATVLLSANIATATDHHTVRKAVQDFMAGHTDKLLSRYGKQSRIEYTITSLDSRLVLSPCPVPLRIEAKERTPMSARLNVQVSCAQGNAWSIYVPVDLRIYKPVVMATRPLTRGETLTQADLQLGEAEVGHNNGQYLTRIEEAAGMDVKRFIAQGTVVQPQQLEPPLMVKRGESVMVSAETGPVAVKMPGIALSDGRRGEQIRIKNKATQRVVQAQITGPGQAIVPM